MHPQHIHLGGGWPCSAACLRVSETATGVRYWLGSLRAWHCGLGCGWPLQSVRQTRAHAKGTRLPYTECQHGVLEEGRDGNWSGWSTSIQPQGGNQRRGDEDMSARGHPLPCGRRTKRRSRQLGQQHCLKRGEDHRDIQPTRGTCSIHPCPLPPLQKCLRTKRPAFQRHLHQMPVAVGEHRSQ